MNYMSSVELNETPMRMEATTFQLKSASVLKCMFVGATVAGKHESLNSVE